MKQDIMEHKLSDKSVCAVIGHGSWATAIVSLLAGNEKEVWWYIKNPEVLGTLVSEGRNPKYLNDLEFDMSRIRPSGDIDEVVSNADIIIMAAPSAYLTTRLQLNISMTDTASHTSKSASYQARHMRKKCHGENCHT